MTKKIAKIIGLISLILIYLLLIWNMTQNGFPIEFTELLKLAWIFGVISLISNSVYAILTDLNQPILEKTTDGEKTTIQTKRQNSSPQTITVSISSIDWTEVSVRSGVFGYWNREVSQQFHEFIAERLER